MNIIAVDDERRALKMLENTLALAAKQATVQGFLTAEAALAYAKDHRVDVAFLDIMMSGMNGLTLAKHLKEIYGEINIIFVTGHNEYAGYAFDIHASGYVLKPVSVERIERELAQLRRPIALDATPHIRIQCFGSFSVFVDGKPLLFTRAKPRELLAYLVHQRGAAVGNAHIASVLWEDQPYSLSVQANTRNVIAQLTHLLKEAHISQIILKARNSIAVNMEAFSCDYYDYLRGDVGAVNEYMGEYMSDFSWAEFTVAYLDSKHRKR